MTQELIDLAERCEKAAGPSYALEVEIWDAVYPGEREERWQEWLRVSPSSMTHNLGPADRDGYIKPRRAFTASLDAAMTLVPEGKRFSCGQGFAGHGPWARIEPDSDARVGSPIHKHGVANRYAETIALALCAAALRARAQQEKTK